MWADLKTTIGAHCAKSTSHVLGRKINGGKHASISFLGHQMLVSLEAYIHCVSEKMHQL